MQKIRIRNHNGKIVTRKAFVTEYLTSDGTVVSQAIYSGLSYRIKDRNFYGPIWCVAS